MPRSTNQLIPSGGGNEKRRKKNQHTNANQRLRDRKAKVTRQLKQSGQLSTSPTPQNSYDVRNAAASLLLRSDEDHNIELNYSRVAYGENLSGKEKLGARLDTMNTSHKVEQYDPHYHSSYTRLDPYSNHSTTIIKKLTIKLDVNNHQIHENKDDLDVYLEFSDKGLSEIPSIYQQMPKVKWMNLRKNRFVRFSLQCTMSRVIYLDLSSNSLETFLSHDVLKSLPSLQCLNLSHNAIKDIPRSSFDILADLWLQELNLSFNQLTSFSKDFTLLRHLKLLDLRHNQYATYDRSLLNIRNFESVVKLNDKSQLLFPPNMSGIHDNLSIHHDGGDDSALPFMQASSLSDYPLDMDYLKILMVGNDSMSKILLKHGLQSFHRLHASDISIQSMQYQSNQYYQSPSSRDYVVITSDLRSHLLAEQLHVHKGLELLDLKLNIWDFVGREDIYHQSMESFFHERALHLVVWNISKPIDEVQCWIDSIQTKAPGSTILIVMIHCEDDHTSKGFANAKMPDAEQIMRKLRKLLDENEEMRLADLRALLPDPDDDPSSMGPLAVQTKVHEDLKDKWRYRRPHIIQNMLSLSIPSINSPQMGIPNGLVALVKEICYQTCPKYEAEVYRNPFLDNLCIKSEYELVHDVIYRLKQGKSLSRVDEIYAEYCKAMGAKLYHINDHDYVQHEKKGSIMKQLRNKMKYHGKNLFSEAEAQDSYYMSSLPPSPDGANEVEAEESSITHQFDLEHQSDAEYDDSNSRIEEEVEEEHSTIEEEEDEGVSSKTRPDSAVDDIVIMITEALQFWNVVGEVIFFSGHDHKENEEFSSSPCEVSLHHDHDSLLSLASDNVSSYAGGESVEEGVFSMDDIVIEEADITKYLESQMNPVQPLSGSHAVFVNPHHFFGALRSLLAERMEDLLQNERRSASIPLSSNLSGMMNALQNEEEEGETAFDHGNGFISWKFLKKILHKLIGLGTTHSLLSHDSCDQDISAVRDALVYLGIIVPICLSDHNQFGNDHSNPNISSNTVDEVLMSHSRDIEGIHQGLDSSSRSSPVQKKSTIYLFPALLQRLSEPSRQTGVPRFAPSGFIRLERVFKLPKFTPSSIISRIIGRILSHQNHGRFKDLSQDMNELSRDKRGFQCWQSCFVYHYHDRTVWVFHDTQHSHPLTSQSTYFNNSSPHINNHSLSTSSSSSSLHQPPLGLQRTSSEYHYSGDDGLPSLTIPTTTESTINYEPKVLKIVIFDYILNINSAVDALQYYTDITKDVLSEYAGLKGVVKIYTVCPICMMKQLPYHECGTISYERIKTIRSSLIDLTDRFLHPDGIEHSYNNDWKMELLKRWKVWEREQLRLCKQGCMFNSDFLIPLPTSLRELRSTSQFDAQMTNYLLEQISITSTNTCRSPYNESKCEDRLINDQDEERIYNLIDRSIVQVKFLLFEPSQQQSFRQLIIDYLYYQSSNNSNSIPWYHDLQPEFRLSTINNQLKQWKASGIILCHSERDILIVLTVCSIKTLQSLNPLFVVHVGNMDYVAQFINTPWHATQIIESQRSNISFTSDAVLIQLLFPVHLINDHRITINLSTLKSSSISSTRYEHSNLLQRGVSFSIEPMFIQQMVYVWSYSTTLMKSSLSIGSSNQRGYWGRIVRKKGDLYLMTLYTDDSGLIGAPVFNIHHQVVGVVSEIPYKNGGQSAYFVAPIYLLCVSTKT